MKISLCIPTLNPRAFVRPIVEAIKQQTLQPDEIIVIDSSSVDGSIDDFHELRAKIIVIKRADFDHGGTRNIAFEMSTADIYVFITQDAIFGDSRSLEHLVNALIMHPKCALAYGRQIALDNVSIFARHARLYNYPPGNQLLLKSIEDVPTLGFKTAFCSNSFAAYRRAAIAEIGFFTSNTLFAEDSIAAAKLLQLGWRVAYVPQAIVEHSHDYTLKQEFCRYFDVGAFHRMNPWYMRLLGAAEGEGVRFVRSEYEYLKNHSVSFALIKIVLRNGFRWAGYKVGKQHQHLPLMLKRRISTNSSFWGKPENISTTKQELP